jgi:endothelin-converting enzyme
LSASILESLDLSQDPCENFYEFASGYLLSSLCVYPYCPADGGWLDKHPLPADKSVFGNFESLAQKNKQVIQKILEANTTHESTYDAALLTKLRDFHSSCLDEKKLDEVGSEPLLHFVNTVRKLYSGNSTDISSTAKSDTEKKRDGLTAAIAFLHSRGLFMNCVSGHPTYVLCFRRWRIVRIRHRR